MRRIPNPFTPSFFAFFSLYTLMILGALLVTPPRANAQILENQQKAGIPSPEAAALVKVEEVPVGYHSGTPRFSIPLHKIVSHDSFMPITLSHHGAAIKPSDQASWVGLGWSLDAGGVVTRTIRGLPDERQTSGYIYTADALAAGYGDTGGITDTQLNDTMFTINPLATWDQNLWNDIDNQFVDPAPDNFFYNFNGHSGQFVLTPDGPQIISQEDVKIDYTTGVITGVPEAQVITKWTFTTSDGTQFVFDEVETTEAASYDMLKFSLSETTKIYVSSWYLTKIISPNGNEITLQYSPSEPVTNLDAGYDQENTLVGGTGSATVCNVDVPRSVSSTQTIHQQKWLDKIIFDTGEVDFNRSLRDDGLNPWNESKQNYKLDQITILGPTGLVLRDIDFTYGYFDGKNDASLSYGDTGKRMRLESVQYSDGNGSLQSPYLFEYNEGTLSSPFSKSLDYWGYYNGMQNDVLYPDFNGTINGSLLHFTGANREPAYDINLLLPGTLKKITYPTGGYTEYGYELNDYGYEGFEPVTTSTPVVTTIPSSLFDYNNTRSPLQYLTQESHFTINSVESTVPVQIVNLYASLETDASCIDGSCGFVTLKEADTGYQIAQLSTPFTTESSAVFDLIPGKDYILESKLGYKYIDSNTGECYQCYVNAEVTYEEVESSKTKIGGGLRIKSISQNDGMDAANTIVRRFTYNLRDDPDRSSGVLVTKPRLYYLDPTGVTCQYLGRAGQSFTPLGSSQGSLVGYKEVTVHFGNILADGSDEYGKSIYDFSTSLRESDKNQWDYWGLSFDMFPFGTQTLRSWKYGLQQKEEQWGADGSLVLKKETDFLLQDEGETGGEPARFKRYLGLNVVPGVLRLDGITNVWAAWYEVTSEFVHPEKVTISNYDPNGANIRVTTTDYQYAGISHLQPTTITERNNDNTVRITETKFPGDYTGSFTGAASTADEYAAKAITRMRDDLHITGTVIEKVIKVIPDGSTTAQVVSSKLNKYKEFATDQILPYEVDELTNDSPLTDFTTSSVSASGLSHDSRYVKSVRFDSYDFNGNISQLSDAKNTPLTALYSYNATLPVASVVNANLDDVFFDGFDQYSDASPLVALWNGDTSNLTLGSDGTLVLTASGNDAQINRALSFMEVGTFIFEADIKPSQPQTIKLASQSLDGSVRTEIRFLPDGNIEADNGFSSASLKSYQPGKWTHIRLEVDRQMATYYVVIDAERFGPFEIYGTNTEVLSINTPLSEIRFTDGTDSGSATIDNIRVYPLDAFMTSATYDPDSYLTREITDPTGQTVSFEYDSFNGLISSSYLNGEVTGQQAYHYSSDENTGVFTNTSPNYVQAITYPDGLDTDSLVGYWRFDGNAHDYSILGNDAIVSTNGLVSEPGYFGQSLSPKYSITYAEVANTPKLEPTNKLTLEAWINLESDPNWDRIVTKAFWSKQTYGSYLLRLGSGTNHKLTLVTKTDTGGKTVLSSSSGVNIGKWTHVVATYDGHEIRIYINGVLDASKSTTGNFIETDQYVGIGASVFPDSLNNTVQNKFHGKIDEVRIYHRAISAEEVASHYNAIVTTNYFDGFGRSVQQQQSADGEAIVTAAAYDSRGREWKTWKPFALANPGYDVNFEADADNYYGADDNGRPYLETLYYSDPRNQARVTLPEGETSESFGVRASLGVTSLGGIMYDFNDSIDEDGKATRICSDVFGNPVQSIAAFGTNDAATTSFTYDVLGQLLQSTTPEGRVTSYRYDTRGRIIGKTTPDFDGDGDENSTNETGIAGAEDERYKYDLAGNLRFIEDANQRSAGHFIYNKYDDMDRLIEVGVYTGITSFDTADANYSTWPDADTQVKTSYTFEGSQLSKVDFEDGSYQFTYDAYGRVATRTVNLNGLTSKTFSYAYNLSGQLNKSSYQKDDAPESFFIWYGSDAFGRVDSVWTNHIDDKGTARVEAVYTYTAAGQVEQLLLGDDPSQTGFNPVQSLDYTYTIRGWLKSMNDPEATLTGAPFEDVFAFELGYDDVSGAPSGATARHNGNISWVQWQQSALSGTSSRLAYNLDYDQRNQLTEADLRPWTGAIWGTTDHYDLSGLTYDKDGNITWLTRNDETGSTMHDLEYDYDGTSNRLRAVANWATQIYWNYTYDANGNLLTDSKRGITTPMVYDYRNLPLSMRVSGTTTTFHYDADGQRIFKSTSGNDTYYVRDTDGSVFAVYEADSLQYWNIPGVGKAVPQSNADPKRFYYVTDHLGSVRTVVDESGNVTAADDYYPFGLQMPGRSLATGETSKEKFTGHELDLESGLLYAGARYYDQTIARWQAVDPLADMHANFSPYNYVLNSPLNLIDPSGEDTLYVILPEDRSKESLAILVVNGNVTWMTFVLGEGAGDKKENPNHESDKINGDTPTGEASTNSDQIVDLDPDGKYAHSNGTPVEGNQSDLPADIKAFGRYFVRFTPESGEILDSGRSGIGGHGGGTALGDGALEAEQELKKTLGCVRMTNKAAAIFVGKIRTADQGDREFKVIISEKDRILHIRYLKPKPLSLLNQP